MEYNILNDMLALECLEVEAFPDVISKHLREVKLVEANGSMREMQLIKLLLAKTPALILDILAAGTLPRSGTFLLISLPLPNPQSFSKLRVKGCMAVYESSNLKDEVSNLELKHSIESPNLKKLDTLDDKVTKLELKAHQLISLFLISWAIIIGFVAAKMMQYGYEVAASLRTGDIGPFHFG
ncbi:hypothetical protein BC332_15615 [Capsicum chinense]|nr:hypothetical protein BC332_15615 [Capsicum chinense]